LKITYVVELMPGIREWGSGLEELTACYLKYVERYIVEVNRAFQETKKIDHPTVSKSKYPYDIDLIAVNPAKRELMLVSCSERWNKSLEKALHEFKIYERFVRSGNGLAFGDEVNVIKAVACVSISKENEMKLSSNGVKVLKFEFMIDKLLEKETATNKKGVHLEPLLWLLQTLKRTGKITS